mmetsp:Transcript_8060/g.16230  ORF Transcript_8060/g.16230 Transcript_8060/m.16230 type:complete len:249 (-) Transcript_8060:228-974(-)
MWTVPGTKFNNPYITQDDSAGSRLTIPVSDVAMKMESMYLAAAAEAASPRVGGDANGDRDGVDGDVDIDAIVGQVEEEELESLIEAPPNVIPELALRSVNDLEVLLDDPEAFIHFVGGLEYVRRVRARSAELHARAAVLNDIQANGGVCNLSEEVERLQKESDALDEEIREKVQEKERIFAKNGPLTLIHKLRMAVDEAEEESKRLEQEYDGSSASLTRYVEGRRAYQTWSHRVKRLESLLEKQGLRV